MTIQKTNTRDNKRKKREGTDKGQDRQGTRPTKESVGGGENQYTQKRRRERRVGKTKTQECSQEKKVRGWEVVETIAVGVVTVIGVRVTPIIGV